MLYCRGCAQVINLDERFINYHYKEPVDEENQQSTPELHSGTSSSVYDEEEAVAKTTPSSRPHGMSRQQFSSLYGGWLKILLLYLWSVPLCSSVAGVSTDEGFGGAEVW
jgi:hypothetical protein